MLKLRPSLERGPGVAPAGELARRLFTTITPFGSCVSVGTSSFVGTRRIGATFQRESLSVPAVPPATVRKALASLR